MDCPNKNFHFQEINWVVCFLSGGNAGKYRDYKVLLIDRKGKAGLSGKRMQLGEILDSAQVDQNYPHTVGYYKTRSVHGEESEPQYLEIREIRSVEEFWAFLNAVNL